MNKFSISNKLKKIMVITVISILVILLVIMSLVIYYLNKQNKVLIIPETYFHIGTNYEKDLKELAKKFVVEYTNQYMQKYVKPSMKLDSVNVYNVEVLDEEKKIVQVDFKAIKHKKNSKYFLNESWGIEENNVITCNWVLALETTENNKEGREICYITQRVRTATYDLEKYNLSGQAKKDDEYYKYMDKKKYLNEEFSYKIENQKIFVTYDRSNTFKEVSIDFTKDLDKEAYKLEDGMFQISKEVTVFAAKNIIAYSNDMGENWKLIDKSFDGDLTYIFFTSKDIGYIVSAVDFAMGKYACIVYKTENAGVSWSKINDTANIGWLSYNSHWKVFSDNLAYVVSPISDGTSSILKVSFDGCKTFSDVVLEPQVLSGDIDGDTSKWNSIYDTPELPKIKDGYMTLVVGQGSDGDYLGGIKAAYRSDDNGITWKFIEEFKPAPDPWEG